MTDQFRHWREAMAAGRGVETERGTPRPGYYRNRNEAVAFWIDASGTLLCWRSDQSRPTPKKPDEIDDLFGFSATHPVSYEVFQAFRNTSRWPEQIEKQIVDESLPSDKRTDAALVSLCDQAAEWIKFIGGKVETQAEADKAANFADAFAKIERETIETHRIAKAPHLAAGREVDALWKPLIDKAALGKTWAKKLCAPFLEAERVRLATENLKRAEQAKQDGFIAPEPLKPKAGTSGRPVHLRKQKTVAVTDMRAFLVHLAEQNDLPEDFIQAVHIHARRMIAAGLKPPGVEVKDEDMPA